MQGGVSRLGCVGVLAIALLAATSLGCEGRTASACGGGECRRAAQDLERRVHGPVRDARGSTPQPEPDVARAVGSSDIARDRAAYGELLQKQLAWLDRRVLELQDELVHAGPTTKLAKEKDLSATRTFRARLGAELDELDRIEDTDWLPLRERIEHDLDEGWPAAVMRLSEKGIEI